MRNWNDLRPNSTGANTARTSLATLCWFRAPLTSWPRVNEDDGYPYHFRLNIGTFNALYNRDRSIMPPMSPSPPLESRRNRHKMEMFPRSPRMRAICWLPNGHSVNLLDAIE